MATNQTTSPVDQLTDQLTNQPTSESTDRAADNPDGTPAVEPFQVGFDFQNNWCARHPADVTYDLAGEIREDHPDVAALVVRELPGLDADDAHDLLKGWVDDLEEMIDDGFFTTEHVEVTAAALAAKIAGFDNLDPAGQDAAVEAAQTAEDEAYAAASALEDKVDDLLEHLRDAAASLTWCEHSCCCASDAYEWAQDDLDSFLASLGERVWAVVDKGYLHPDTAEDDIDGELNLETVFKRTGCENSGWASVDLKWDGKQLDASFLIDRGGHTGLILTPLENVQQNIRLLWLDSDSWAEDIAGRVVLANQEALDVTATLWTEVDEPDEAFGGFESLLEAVTEVGPAALEDLDSSIVARLAPTWTAKATDLLNTSLNLMGVPVTAFAA